MNNAPNRQVVTLAAGAMGAMAVYVLIKDKDASAALMAAMVTLVVGVLATYWGGASSSLQDAAAIAEGVRRAGQGEKPSAPVGASPEIARVFDELARLSDDALRRERETKATHAELEAIVRRLQEGMQQQLSAADEASRLFKDLIGTSRALSSSVEVLAQNTDSSTSPMADVGSTSASVADSLAQLSTSVRETLTALEQMAASVREIAKSTDGLSRSAEETSASINAIDASIAEVQANANETVRLSEEVALDADKGAAAISKTIGEIVRIKESSLEAVAAISTLGSRIEAIGQIVNVIDDVAEQTNLLSLNAAIIAAQAGEQGKGFAVVADEIKDLAERAGASTREITDLIKTVQRESRSAIAAVERGAQNVERGVLVSSDADRVLTKVLESSQKSTSMVRAIARATVEQATSSRHVTEAMGRIVETVRQVASVTSQQAHRSEHVLRGAESIRGLTQHLERSTSEQARSSRQLAGAVQTLTGTMGGVSASVRAQNDVARQASAAMSRVEDLTRTQDAALRQLSGAVSTHRSR